MIASIRLPAIGTLRLLADDILDYPVTGLGVTQWAEHMGYEDDVVGFTKLYSKNIVFKSRSDFLNHCRLLGRLLKEESKSVKEYTRSPQD